MSGRIYSTDPNLDLLKWPPNNVTLYNGLVPGTNIPEKLPNYWASISSDISFNQFWNYGVQYKAWDANGNIQKLTAMIPHVYLSAGG